MSGPRVSYLSACALDALKASASNHRRVRVRRDRRGVALVWFALLVFGILAIGAIVADLGQVSLVRRQMQAAVNTAALEGLYFRNGIPSQDWLTQNIDNIDSYLTATGGSSLTTTAASDLTSTDYDGIRRWAAATVASQVLSYSATQSGIKTTALSGSGTAIVTGDGTTTEFLPYQLIAGASTSYGSGSPLQPNGNNAANGDLVAGQFNSSTFSHQEYATYSRYDFTQADQDNPTTVTNSFLVRMRLTNGPVNSASLDNESGVGSSGATIPYMFGRPMGAGGTDPAVTWNQLAQGVSVRATAIADARPAISVGKTQTYSDTLGNVQTITGLLAINSTLSIQLRADWKAGSSTMSAWYSTMWQPQPTGSVPATTQSVTFTISSGGALVSTDGTTTIGNIIAAPSDNFLTIGMPTTATTLSGTTLTTATGIAPLVANINGVDSIIGFAQVTATNINGTNYSLTRQFNEIAAPGLVNAWGNFPVADANCMSSLAAAMATLSSSELMQARDQLVNAALSTSSSTSSTTTQAFPLLSPALVRSVAVPSPP